MKYERHVEVVKVRRPKNNTPVVDERAERMRANWRHIDGLEPIMVIEPEPVLENSVKFSTKKKLDTSSIEATWESILIQEGLGDIGYSSVIKPETFSIFIDTFEQTKDEKFVNQKILKRFQFGNAFEREVFKLYVDGFSMREIETLVDNSMTKSSIQRFIQKVHIQFYQQKPACILRKRK